LFNFSSSALETGGVNYMILKYFRKKTGDFDSTYSQAGKNHLNMGVFKKKANFFAENVRQ
jgi:hypothetical protein